MMDIMKEFKKQTLKSEDNKTLTQNGDVTYKSIGSGLLDMDAEVMALRNQTPEEVMKKFEKAYLENPENAIVWLFMVGDIRGGKGERDTFNRCMDKLVKENPAVVNAVMPLIPEYTRWDYVTRLMLSNHIGVSKMAESIVVEQLKKDIQDGKEGKPISLLAKWMPSIQTKKPEQRKIVFKVEKSMGLDHKGYRKTIAELRDKLNIIEKSLSTKNLSNINMESLTSHQNLAYGKTLERIDPVVRDAFLNKVMNDEAKMHAEVVYPYEIVNKYNGYYRPKEYNLNYEAMWHSLPREDVGNTLVIRDGSGSMTSRVNDKTQATCLDVATAFSVFFAEQLKGPMKDKFITFSSSPEIVDMSHVDSLYDKLRICSKYDDCSNTNIQKTFDILLKTFVDAHASQEDMPENLLILSDMEFDSCFTETKENRGYWGELTVWNKSVFEHIQEEFKEHGYELPRLVFWNINATRAVFPVIDNERGLVILSGFSQDTYNMVARGEFDKIVVDKETGKEKVVTMTPEEQMEKRLSAERYAPVRKAIEPVLYPNKARNAIINDISLETAKAEINKER